MQKDKISVVIPTYNRAKLIPRAICSVLNQTYSNTEIIIIDDASKDNTSIICNKMIDDRIKYIQFEKNRGAPAARNTGIREATGKYIAFLDSDDEWMPNKLEKQVSSMESHNSKVGLVYTGYYYVKNQNDIVGESTPAQNRYLKNNIALLNFIGPLSSVLVIKKCFERCGNFDEHMPSCQDWDLYIRLAKMYQFTSLEEPLVKHHIDNERITTNSGAKAKGHTMILEKYFDEIKEYRKYYSKQLFVIAHYNALSGEMRRSKTNFIKAIFVYPFKIKYYIHLICSLFGKLPYLKIANLKKKLVHSE